MTTETAKNLLARPNDLKSILKNSELMQYAVEMFTNDDNDDFHPENLKIFSAYNRIVVQEIINGEIREIGNVVKCNKCGNFEIACHDGGATYETQFCNECGLEFTQIGECKNIEW